MTITLPIYVRTVDAADGQGRAYEVRPLFHSAPARRDPSLERALSLLATDLRKHLRELGRRDRHDELAEWAFCPEIESRRVDLIIELRRSRPRVPLKMRCKDRFGSCVFRCHRDACARAKERGSPCCMHPFSWGELSLPRVMTVRSAWKASFPD